MDHSIRNQIIIINREYSKSYDPSLKHRIKDMKTERSKGGIVVIYLTFTLQPTERQISLLYKTVENWTLYKM